MNTDVTNKNTALQERTEIFKPSQKHGVEVWDYGLSGQLEKKNKSGDGPRVGLASAFCKREMRGWGKWVCPGGQFSFRRPQLSASWTLVGDVQGERFIGQESREVDSNREPNAGLSRSRLLATALGAPWAEPQAAPFCFASRLSWRLGGAQDLHYKALIRRTSANWHWGYSELGDRGLHFISLLIPLADQNQAQTLPLLPCCGDSETTEE